MITDKGVRAGINPAPTNTPLQTTFRVGDNSPQFSVKGDKVGAGFIPALTPNFIYTGDNVPYPRKRYRYKMCISVRIQGKKNPSRLSALYRFEMRGIQYS